MQATTSEQKFEVIVIATSAKPVTTHSHNKVATLKRAAMHEFGIPESSANEYRLATSPGNPGSELDDDKTVTDVGLHNGSKVYLIKPHTDAS